MTVITIILACGTMLLLAVLAAYALGWADRVFRIPADPRLEAVLAALPGVNCGGCGYVGCGEYAAAVVAGSVEVNKCTVGGVSCAAALAGILGVEVKPAWPYRPAVHCGATFAQRLKRADYRGERTCAAANVISGVQGCAYGCLGFCDCQLACDFDAIHVINGLAVVDYEKCVGCGACERACPRHIISMVPFKAERMLVVACSNKDAGRDVRAVCKVGCIGCRACQRTSELFQMAENLSTIDYESYDPDKMPDLDILVARCPMKRIVAVGKPSAKDLAAVAGQELPDIVTGRFRTTADEAEWRG